LGGVEVGFSRRAPGYAGDAAVWRALRERPGTAVVTAAAYSNAVTVPGSAQSATMAPLTVWARLPDSGGPVKLTVIGVVDARSELDPAIYTSRATAASLGVAPPAPHHYHFAVAPGVRLLVPAEGQTL